MPCPGRNGFTPSEPRAEAPQRAGASLGSCSPSGRWKNPFSQTVQDGSPQRPPSVQQGEKDNLPEASQAQKRGESAGKATALAGCGQDAGKRATLTHCLRADSEPGGLSPEHSCLWRPQPPAPRERRSSRSGAPEEDPHQPPLGLHKGWHCHGSEHGPHSGRTGPQAGY